MKIRLASALISGLMISGASQAMAAAPVAPAAAPAAAPVGTTPGGIVASGVAVANPPAIVGNATAYQVAQQQRPTYYKPQIDQAQTRRNQIAAQLKPLYDKLEADSKNPKADRAALQQQAVQIQQIEQNGEREIQKLLEPLNLSQQYVLEQIGDKLDQATQNAMTKKKVTLVLDSQSIIKADQVYNLNQDILNELNVLIPSAQLVPPAGWMPRAQREQAAQQAAQQQAQAPAAPAGKQPEGR